MIWEDLYFDKTVTKVELQYALSRAFSVDIESIIVSGNLQRITCIPESTSIYCNSYKVGREHFIKTRILVYLLSIPVPTNDLKPISIISRTLGCNVYIGDYSDDPDNWIKVSTTEIGDISCIDDFLQEAELR